MFGSSRHPTSAAFAAVLACFAGSPGNVYAQNLQNQDLTDLNNSSPQWEELSNETYLKDQSLFTENESEFDNGMTEEDLPLNLEEDNGFENNSVAESLGFARSQSTYQMNAPELEEGLHTRIVQKAEAFSGVPEDVLVASRDRFQRTFSVKKPTHSQAVNPTIASHAPLLREKAYTFLNGNLVEIDKNSDFSDKPYPLWQSNLKGSIPIEPIKIVVKPKLIPQQNAALHGKGPLMGYISVPKGTDPQSVVLQLGGTSQRVRPNKQGDFLFPNLPLGSNFSVVAWDENNDLNRSLYTVSHHTLESNHHIEFVKKSLIDQLSFMFGTPHQINLSGFCGRLEGVLPHEYEGALVEVRTSHKSYPVHFFNDLHLPDPYATGVTLDGRFCSFNINSQLTSVLVQLPNGQRKRFVIPFKASTFESNMAFPMDQHAYIPVNSMEYVDSDIALVANQIGERLKAGEFRPRSFLEGFQAPMLAFISHLVLNTDKTYKSVWSGPQTQRHYFPITQNFSEVFSKGPTADDEGSFQLFSSHKLRSQGEQPLAIRSMGEGIRDAMALSLNNLSASWKKEGSVFIDIDLLKLGIKDATQVSLAIRDPWTAQPVGQYHSIPHHPDVKMPRFLRGFFTDIPEGQYTLVVRYGASEVKWLETVRAYKKSLQVVSLD